MSYGSDFLSVLVQEPDAALRSLISDVLTAEGFRVIQAESEQDGLLLIDQQQPDLLLLDMSPPAPARERSIHLLSADTGRFDLSLIMLSGYAVLSRGADQYAVVGLIQKPFDLDSLLAYVAQAAAQCRS
jgi:two-component system phosphate regulon response regulator PhoB